MLLNRWAWTLNRFLADSRSNFIPYDRNKQEKYFFFHYELKLSRFDQKNDFLMALVITGSLFFSRHCQDMEILLANVLKTNKINPPFIEDLHYVVNKAATVQNRHDKVEPLLNAKQQDEQSKWSIWESSDATSTFNHRKLNNQKASVLMDVVTQSCWQKLSSSFWAASSLKRSYRRAFHHEFFITASQPENSSSYRPMNIKHS